MARHVFTAEECRKGDKRAGGRKSFEDKAGFHGLPEEDKIRNASLAGRARGRKSLEAKLGIFSLSADEKLKNAALGGKVGGLARVEKGFSVISDDELQKISTLGAHRRWHFSRSIFNLECDHCLAAMQRKENWGVAVKEPE